MNKLVKGSIAGAAGIALLLGGAGTFALWNDSVTVAAGTVSTGELKIVANATPAAVWTEQSATGARNGAVGSTIDTTAVKMVPGDTWRYTKTLTLTTTGKNLIADLTFDPASIVVAGSTIPATELEYKFVAAAPTPVVAANATVVQNATNTNVYRVTPGTGSTTTVTVTFDITFKDIAPATNVAAGQNKSIDVSGLKLTLNQVRP